MALADRLILAGWPADSRTLARCLVRSLWLADWLSLAGWLAGWLSARPTTYIPSSRLTCLLITSETISVHLVYGVKFWGFNRCHSKCPRNKNMLETCKSPRSTSARSELAKSCTTSTMNFHMMYYSWIPKNNASLKLPCKFGNQNTIVVKISHRRLHMAQITRMSLMST